MEDNNTVKQAMEDISFIKRIITASQVQLNTLSNIFFIIVIYEAVANLAKFLSYFTVNSIKQQYIISLAFGIINLVFLCVLAIIFFIKRNRMNKTSGQRSVHFIDLWGVVFFFPAVFNIIKIIIFVAEDAFNISSAFKDHYLTMSILQALQVAILCIALIATGHILNHQFTVVWGITVLLLYLMTFMFPKSIEFPGSFTNISLMPQSLYTAAAYPLTYLMMGLYLKKRAGDSNGNS